MEELNQFIVEFDHIPVKPFKSFTQAERRQVEYNMLEIDLDFDRLNNLYITYRL